MASLKKFKAVARFVGKAQVAKNKNKRKRVVTPDDEARKENPDFALGLNMAKFKAAAVVVGKVAAAGGGGRVRSALVASPSLSHLGVACGEAGALLEQAHKALSL